MLLENLFYQLPEKKEDLHYLAFQFNLEFEHANELERCEAAMQKLDNVVRSNYNWPFAMKSQDRTEISYDASIVYNNPLFLLFRQYSIITNYSCLIEKGKVSNSDLFFITRDKNSERLLSLYDLLTMKIQYEESPEAIQQIDELIKFRHGRQIF